MFKLPIADELDINKLSGCFRSVANSYKFYLFLAILDHLKVKNTLIIKFDELSLRMISLAWYPLVYFKLSFGRQDSFKGIAIRIADKVVIDIRPGSKSLYSQIKLHPDEELKYSLIKEINKTLREYAVYRFIRPFFADELKGLRDGKVDDAIIELANDNVGKAPYSFTQESIIIDPSWAAYFNRHQHILRGFIKWNLLNFLTTNNPNVIGLARKIDQPQKRHLTLAKLYWGNYIKENTAYCIYSNQLLNHETLSIDHFIPWSYVAHDELWNLIPTTGSINSAKGDALPDLDKNLEKFCQMHYDAIVFYKEQKHFEIFEYYYSIFHPSEIDDITYDKFYGKMQLEFTNHVRVAKSLGFAKTFQM